MEERQVLYNEETSSFVLQLFVTPETTVKGEVIVELANAFLDDLVLSGYERQWLWTRRGRPDDAKLNIGDFSERRWKDAIKKIRAGEYGAL
ncbi:MAG TPA: hypothetical protein VE422_13135, partial [Terriglobia bacterium]|nr:hypothetical protein [Terriglobia bacterium]